MLIDLNNYGKNGSVKESTIMRMAWFIRIINDNLAKKIFFWYPN